MQSDQATITWGEGLAAVLTLGMITVLLGGKPARESHRMSTGPRLEQHGCTHPATCGREGE